MSRYQEAGVDVNAGYEMVKKIKQDVASTARLGMLGSLGSRSEERRVGKECRR